MVHDKEFFKHFILSSCFERRAALVLSLTDIKEDARLVLNHEEVEKNIEQSLDHLVAEGVLQIDKSGLYSRVKKKG